MTGDRRDFLKTATGLATITGSSAAEKSAQRIYSGAQLQEISFPLGGVGTGCIGLGGRGELRDWEIFNRSDKGNSPAYAFGAICVLTAGSVPFARVLEGRRTPPFDGPRGLGAVNAPGLPRFESTAFRGEFPIADVQFIESGAPVRVKLEAFSPFTPPDADESGLPVAVLRYEALNLAASTTKVTIAFSVDNPVGVIGRENAVVRAPGLSGIHMLNRSIAEDDALEGSLALCALEQDGTAVSILPGWESSSRWRIGAQRFWDVFAQTGDLPPFADKPGTTGSLAISATLRPGARRTFTFLLAWRFPNRTPVRCGWDAPPGGENAILGNYYCTRFRTAWEAAQYTATHLQRLEGATRAFVKKTAALPAEVREAALANLSTLITPVCFRTADGAFYGFEGSNEQSGAWFGNCTHVWNYETATPFLFPAWSRSMRETAFGYSTDSRGCMRLRTLLPPGKARFEYSAVDGQMGQIMRLYLDWRLSQDDAWLRRLWPAAKRALEFAWVPGGWDADRDGVMEGAQHNTYDIEFYGPNPLCSVWYLGALRAAEEMARSVGEPTAATEYRRLFEQGSRWIDAKLFNGEYYVQKVRGLPRGQIAPGLLSGLGPNDSEHPDLQPGNGCLADQLAGQCLAYVAGLGPLLDKRHLRRTLESIYRYNFKRRLGEVAAVDRVLALQDEAGLILCAYPHEPAPADRFPRFHEVWSGVEYTVAALMLYEGMREPALEIIRAVRRRYDGQRRNPWGETEAGWHYVRAMASWSCLRAVT